MDTATKPDIQLKSVKDKRSLNDRQEQEENQAPAEISTTVCTFKSGTFRRSCRITEIRRQMQSPLTQTLRAVATLGLAALLPLYPLYAC